MNKRENLLNKNINNIVKNYLKNVVNNMDKLVAYNEMDEKGLLKRVDFDIEDQLYFIVNNKVVKYEVTRIEITKEHIIYNCKPLKDGFPNGYFTIKEFNKTVFLTKKEALITILMNKYLKDKINNSLFFINRKEEK